MKPLRLVIVTQRFWPSVGGAENLLGNLAAGLAADGCRVTLLTARWRPAWPEEICFHEVSVIRLSPPPEEGWPTLRYQRSLARWLRHNPDRYDLACVSGLGHDAYATLCAVRGRVPVVLRAERAGSHGDCLWQQQATCGRRIRKRCLQAAALIAPSETIQRELQAAGYPVARIHYAPNGVALPSPRTAAGRAAARSVLAETDAVLRMPEGAPLVLCVGSFHRHQGLKLLSAWKPLAARWPGARLWLAGDGPDRAALQAAIEDLNLSGRAVLIGVFDGVDELLSAADLFVMPSPEAAESLSLLEAMAAGLPIVAAGAGDNHARIADGYQGLLVPAEDAAAMSAAIHRLLDRRDLAARLGAAARQRAAQSSLARMVEQHLTLFEQVIAAER